MVRDNGFLASLESRIPLLKFASGEEMLLKFAQFVDLGRAWLPRTSTPPPDTGQRRSRDALERAARAKKARFELDGSAAQSSSQPAGQHPRPWGFIFRVS